MRRIVISDIHGMYDLFRKTLEDNKYNPKEDKLILLGDYIDRGEKSYEVVKFIQTLQRDNDVIALKGNHEDMAENAILTRDNSLWFYNGGQETVLSYLLHDKDITDDLNWLSSLPIFYKEGDLFFVHAGVNPAYSFKHQNKEDMLWIRKEFFLHPKKYAYTVIFGHTPITREPYHTSINNNTVDIDAGAVFTGHMTAFSL
jgi:serine/threonine protein phosphatase 1